MDLTPASAIAQTLGRAVPQDLLTLCQQGHIREHLGRRFDGTAATLYSIAAKGLALLAEMDRTAVPEAGAALRGSAQPPNREAYDGSEMHPFDGRRGSLDALRHPSRVGERLYYRDGAVESFRIGDSTSGKPWRAS